MTKRMIAVLAFACAAVLFTSTVALAAANVWLSGNDPTSCLDTSPAADTCFHPYGQIGKGDVQLALGWNNAQLQNNVGINVGTEPRLQFGVDARDTYSAVCRFITGEGTPGEQTHDVTIPRHVTLNASATYKDKKHTQIDGFNLTNATSQTNGTVPVVGGDCVADDHGIARNGTWYSVNLTSTTGDGLTVTWDANDNDIFGDDGDRTETIAGATINP